jgi:hypothetical protein
LGNSKQLVFEIAVGAEPSIYVRQWIDVNHPIEVRGRHNKQ